MMVLISKSKDLCLLLSHVIFLFIYCEASFSDRDDYYTSDAEWVINVENSTSFSGLPKETYQPKIKSVSIKSKIRFRYARTRIISTVMNPDPDKSHTVNFTLRIPMEAFISKFEMRIDGGPETYKANLTRVEEARKLYELAMSEGRTVTLGLVENSNNGSFEDLSMNFIIGAHKTVLFMLIYEERLPRKLGMYEHIIHLVPEQISKKTSYRIEVLIEETEMVNNVSVVSPFGSNFSESSCESFYKDALVERISDKKVKIIWSNTYENDKQNQCQNTLGEFGVRYQLKDTSSVGHVLIRNGYFVHFFTPENMEPLRKHIVFVLDISDSMVGEKMIQLQDAMINILDSLGINDFFNMIAFSSNVEVWSKYHGQAKKYLFPYPAKEFYKDSARFWVKHLNSSGSTNIHLALTTALELCKNVSALENDPEPKMYGQTKLLKQRLTLGVQSMIIFLTDGEPTSGIIDKFRILSEIKRINHKLAVPIFSLAFGTLADFDFLKTISLRNRGFARKIYENADAELQLTDFYAEIASPILSNVSFEYISPTLDLGSVIKQGYHPMIFDGAEIVIAGKIFPKSSEELQSNLTRNLSNLKASVYANGRLGKKYYEIPVKDCRRESEQCEDELELDDKCIEKLFIYMTIKRLMEKEASQKAFLKGDQFCLGNVMQNDVDLLDYQTSEKIIQNCTDRFKNKAVDMALEFGFVIPGVSLVMNTKSIREEEMDVAYADQTANTQEWEFFYGSELPLSNGSKLIDSRKPRPEDKYVYQELLPTAQAFTESDLKNELRPYQFQSLDGSSNSLHFNSKQILTLKNISWLSDSSKYVNAISIPNSKGNSITYQIASNQWILENAKSLQETEWSTTVLPCKDQSTQTTTCKHLTYCVLEEFLDDFKAYTESYFCPLRYEENLFLGVCCPDG